jgi:hypothetical protein
LIQEEVTIDKKELHEAECIESDNESEEEKNQKKWKPFSGTSSFKTFSL